MKGNYIDISDYDYELPENRIAQYPVERDKSKLLVYKNSFISQDIFSNISSHIPTGSLLVFNDSSVIKARLLFGKNTGARIEVLCLEPSAPQDYEKSFKSSDEVEWKCLAGNLKKWKRGSISLNFICDGKQATLEAEKVRQEGEFLIVRFRWTPADIQFEKVLDNAGHIPLPPYITRQDQDSDASDYQTVYSAARGSVAAPTAGLHFTDDVLHAIRQKSISSTRITLHVGAGTFKPVKSSNVCEHEMHNEHFVVTLETIKDLIENYGRIIAVGTTSVRTIESLYWLGLRLMRNQEDTQSLPVSQWEPYEQNSDVSGNEALKAILNYMLSKNILSLYASTSLIIVPGYKFRLTKGIITNFHQPRSTLLLLISAWTGEKWEEIYKYALENEFRFLSYGDSSILLPHI